MSNSILNVFLLECYVFFFMFGELGSWNQIFALGRDLGGLYIWVCNFCVFICIIWFLSLMLWCIFNQGVCEVFLWCLFGDDILVFYALGRIRMWWFFFMKNWNSVWLVVGEGFFDSGRPSECWMFPVGESCLGWF